MNKNEALKLYNEVKKYIIDELHKKYGLSKKKAEKILENTSFKEWYLMYPEYADHYITDDYIYELYQLRDVIEE